IRQTLPSPSDAYIAPRVEDRHINAWIENADAPLLEGELYTFGVNIGKLRAQALSGAKLPELHWPDTEQLALLIVLSGPDFEIQPRSVEITLPRHGDTAPAFFRIRPRKSALSLLRVSLYLARELALLEEFEIPIPVKEKLKAA